MSHFADYARALQVLEEHLARRRAGAAEPAESLLARHPDLAEILAPMLEGGASGAAAERPGAHWLGMPSDGDEVGGYRIERTLGQGGMGVVFEASDARLERKVALKLVRPERLGSQTARERFAREAKLVARLEHPNICPVYEVGEANGLPFMAMRLLRGTTLAARCLRPAAAPTRAELEPTLRIFEQVARALQHAHERGIVHRDIKPANVWITHDGTPVVLDFGMARSGDETEAHLTLTGEVAGTPLYMAPEQIRGSTRVDGRADVWALGVTLYEAVTGTRPFAGQSLRELQDAILGGDPVPASRLVPGLPREIDVVIGKALEKDPMRRYASAAALADDLARLVRREPVHARRPSPWLRLSRWVQRNPVAVALLATGTVALVVITFLYASVVSWRRDFGLVSLVPRLEELRADEERLYDRWPDHAEAMRAWIARAEELLSRRPAVESAVARLRGSAVPGDAFLRDALAGVARDLEALRKTEGGAVPRVRANLDAVGPERERSLAAAADRWSRACAEVAAEPLYRGLVLAPQLGLVPLGADPASRLQEFWHWRSGSEPTRGADGSMRVTDATGIVLVLLPGGKFTMGCSDEPGSAQYDPRARYEEKPPREVVLAPFLIGKHEMTQGQWQRLAGGVNPSDARPGGGWRMEKQLGLSLCHPVESVQWRECVALLAQSGLVLPTEAQWEYACRAGTTTVWWTGDAQASVAGRMNLADRAAKAAGLKWSQIDESVDDGFAIHAPVDAFEPNAFGLHQMTGNVWEWCRDVYFPYSVQPAAGDGLREGKPTGGEKVQRVTRGGSFDGTFANARSALRRVSDPALRDFGLGLRAARPLR